METTKKQSSHWWWFDSHNNNPARSQWLQSTLSVLDEKTEEMLRIIEEDADSFSQRAEMYYKKRPQLVGMVEDFYRAHRSLAEQFDHLRHEPGTRRTSPLARSFSLKMDQQEKEVLDPPKSYESEDSSEKSLDLVKPFEGCYTDLAYDSDEYVDSEVDDPILEAKDEAIDMGKVLMSAPMNHQDLIDEIERLKEENLIQKKQLMEKDNKIGELKLKLSETANEIKTLREEAGKLRMENVEMYLQKINEAEERDVMAMNLKKENEQLIVENSTLNKLLIQKDKETREAMKLSETATEVKTLREEAGKLRMENVEMCLQKINEAEERDMMAMNLKKEMEQLVVKNSTLNKLLIQKDKETREAMKLSETATEIKTLRKEAGKLRMENVEMYLQKIKEAEERDMLAMNLKKEKEQLIVENSTLNKLLIQKDEETRKEMEVKCVERKKVENEVGVLLMKIKEQREMLEEKDEGKREAIRQLSLAIEMLKGENRLLKKTIVNGSNKKWNPFELQVLKGFGKLLNCSIMSSKPSVVPL